MRPIRARGWTGFGLAIALTTLASSCGSGGTPQGGANPPPGTPPPFVLPDTPNPVDAVIAVEPENAATAPMTPDGGTLTATGGDGTVYTLTLPPNALLDPATITMTPIRSVAGVDFFAGRWIGVRLEPDGLALYSHATLRMTPPEGERLHAFAFSAHGDGRELHGQPLTADASRLEMKLLHFSDEGARVCGGDCGGGSLQALDPSTPTEWEARLQNYLEWLFRQDRERQLSGLPSDPDLWAAIEAVFHEYWTRVIEPMLPRMLTDCSFAEEHLPHAISFSRSIDLLNLGARFAAEEDQVKRTVMAAIENCFAQAAQPCIDQTNLEQMQKLWLYTHQYTLMANGDAPFDPRDPGLQCGSIWTGTSRVVYAMGPDPAANSVTMAASFVFEVDDAASTQSIQVLRVKSGSASWDYILTDGACTTRGGPQTFTLLPQDGEITLFLGGVETTFTAQGEMIRTEPVATYSTTCTDGRQYSTQGAVGGTWLVVPDGTPAFPEGRGTMTGAITIGPYVSEWSFSR